MKPKRGSDSTTRCRTFKIGAAGVDLFFVISGFIMVYASEPLFGHASAPAIFFKRRLARIVPLYWAATAATIILFFVLKNTAQLTPGMTIAALLFFPYARPDGALLPVHMLGWTLNLEMMFYAVFAAALVLSRWAAVVAIATLFVVVVLADMWIGPFPQPFAFWSQPIILEFCAGMFIALAVRTRWRMPALAANCLVAAGILGFIVASVYPGLPRLIAWGFPAIAVVAGMALGPSRGTGPVSRLFAFQGDASYSLYLVHFLVIVVLGHAAAYFRIDLLDWRWTYITALVASSIAASLVVYVLFENPVTAALQGYLRQREPRLREAVSGT